MTQVTPRTPPAGNSRTTTPSQRRAGPDLAETQAQDLPGRQAVAGLLERRFPRVLRPFGDLRAKRSDSTRAASVRAALTRCAALLLLWRDRSRMRKALSRISDAERRDLGLSPAQIIQEVIKPFWKA